MAAIPIAPNARSPLAAILAVAVFLVVVAATTWHAKPSHTTLASTPVEADVALAPPPRPPRAHRVPAAATDPRLSPVATRQRLLGRAPAVAAAIAAGRQALVARYDDERVDAAWAARKETALASANDAPQIGEVGAKPLAFSAQCRTSVCLMGADFATALAADDWVSLYTLVAGPEMSRASVRRSANPDGTIHLQVYALAR